MGALYGNKVRVDIEGSDRVICCCCFSSESSEKRGGEEDSSGYRDCKASGGKVVSNVFCLPAQYRKDVIPPSGQHHGI